MRTSGWARFDKAPSWMPTAAAKTSFRIAFSASEPVIWSTNVDFIDAVDIACFFQTRSISFLVLFYRHTILSKRCGSGVSGPGNLQDRRELLAFSLLVNRVEELFRTLTLVKISL
jgi:hypothetical protein